MPPALLTATLTFFLSLGTSVAADPQESTAGDALLEVVAAGPLSLTDVLAPTHGGHRRVLRIRFALDTDGQLVAQVLLRVTESGQASFHEWAGPVYSAGWVPRQRVLTHRTEVAEATRLWALKPARDVLWEAIIKAVEKKAPGRLADVVLSAVPSSRGGHKTVDLLVGLDGQARSLVFDPSNRTFQRQSVAAPERVPVDMRSLPELEVPDGQWFNAAKPLTLPALLGKPVLLLTTTSDCDDCLETYTHLVRWNKRYAEQGLEVITIYGSQHPEPQNMRGMLRARKITYPVLRDPSGSYIKALGLGAWPLVTLLDREGRVVWQGQAGGARFSAPCEKALEELMRATPKKEASSDSGPR